MNRLLLISAPSGAVSVLYAAADMKLEAISTQTKWPALTLQIYRPTVIEHCIYKLTFSLSLLQHAFRAWGTLKTSPNTSSPSVGLAMLVICFLFLLKDMSGCFQLA
ncbi:hypothetical protein BCR41DRAFT_373543 [Lobosporangium transversale]|uniref:Uncharacterized protein n=1 Tax=Lobosporangium transversale TaxID=64571 RepID=A0A1Y2GFQ8_9FUNG|nr:hypothetical protein BCR41DRAFT_373543 [Lobosporangium transversale]ORZ07785.1 hypothetical protein BCR41DRAFT_373543 [Lobosporangium transversale]|eukprot:XP_021878151.1 hypothetical protein BCR41DRAFT_373543 [Lobosporangium transversale]